MIHRVSSVAVGNSEDLHRAGDVLSQHDEAICELYMEKTGLLREKILDMMAQETYLTAKEAVEHGFVDAVADDTGRLVAGPVPMLNDVQVQKIMAMMGAGLPDGKADPLLRAKAKLKLLQLGGMKR